MITFKQKIYSDVDKQIFIEFLCSLEGFKTRTKNLHWSAPKNNIHTRLDEFLEIIDEYEDGLAEGYMGILGQMGPNEINGTPCNASDAISLINEVEERTKQFYESIPEGIEFKGITSECETFIQNIQKYSYLFNLCV